MRRWGSAPLPFWRRIQSLPASTWVRLAAVLPGVLSARVALWVLPYRKVQILFEPTRPEAPTRPPSYVHETARVAGWVGRTFLGDKPCLAQALAARWLLGRAGYETDLKIGAAIENGEFRAHAWLERNGRVILGGRDSPARYVPFSTYSRRDRIGERHPTA